MAFTQSTFAPVGSRGSDVPGFWTYKTPDLFAAVIAPGYFTDKRFQLSVGDFIWVIALDARRIVRYDGETEPLEIIAPKPPIPVMNAFSFVNQQPSVLDTPLQVNMGAAQNTIDDAVMLDALGNITINQAGFYNVSVIVDVGRFGSSGGVANIFMRGLKNGVQVGNPIATFINDPNTIIPEQFELANNLVSGDVVTIEILRDSAGVNEGGLFTQPNALGWGNSASIALRITRLV